MEKSILINQINKSIVGKESPIINKDNKRISKTIKKLFEEWGT